MKKECIEKTELLSMIMISVVTYVEDLPGCRNRGALPFYRSAVADMPAARFLNVIKKWVTFEIWQGRAAF